VNPSRRIAGPRPRSRRDGVGVHLPLALIAGLALLLSALVPLDYMPFKACTFLHFTGYPCPFCGFTRSFWALSGGDWAYAMYNCPLSVPVFGIVVFHFLWNAVALLLGLRMRTNPFSRLRPGITPWVWVSVSVLVALNWAYRLALGLT